MAVSTKHTARSVLDQFYAAEKKFIAAKPEEQDFDILRPLFSEDFKLYQTSGLPYAGTYHGPDGMLEWMQAAAKWCDKLDVQDSEIFEKEGSSRIMISATVHFRIRETGVEVSYPLAQAINVDLERGVITEIRPWYWDVYDLNEKLGYDPKKVNESR